MSHAQDTTAVVATSAMRTRTESIGADAFTIDVAWTHAAAPAIHDLLQRLVKGSTHTVTLLAGTEVSAWPNVGTTAWWEHLLLERGFRKSTRTPGTPMRLQRTNGGALVRHPIIFERLDAAVLSRYPLVTLWTERNLHMDMLREAGPRSDAHLARYRWACRFIEPGAIVIDAACGLGYGTALMADTTLASRLVGIDDSAYAIDYSQMLWSAGRSHVTYYRGDVRTVPAVEDSVDVVASIETMEHLEDDGPLLQEFRRVLKPGGVLLGSVPNLWIDATGKDPSPYHHQVFDRERLFGVLAPYFDVFELWQQNAALDRDEQAVAPIFQQIGLDGTGVDGKPEWLVFAARRR